MSTDYAAFWKAIADNRDWEQEERIAHSMYDAPVDWCVNPSGGAVSAWNHYARLRLWAHGETSDLAAWCLDVAKRDVDEAERQDEFERSALPGAFPLNRFGFLMAKVFVDAFAGRGARDAQSRAWPARAVREGTARDHAAHRGRPRRHAASTRRGGRVPAYDLDRAFDMLWADPGASCTARRWRGLNAPATFPS